MKVDSRREVRGVSETARFALDAHDLAIEPLGRAVGDRVLDEPEHTGDVALERGGDGLDGVELRANGPTVPPGEESLHRGGLTVGPQGAQGLFDRPGATDLQMPRLECGEGGGMTIGTAFIAEQPHVLGAGERRVLAVAKKRPMFLLAHRVDGRRHIPHDVEPVELPGSSLTCRQVCVAQQTAVHSVNAVVCEGSPDAGSLTIPVLGRNLADGATPWRRSKT
jgi:hypothetical protein